MENMYFALMRERNVLGLDILQQNRSFFVLYASLYDKARRQHIYSRNGCLKSFILPKLF